MNFLKKAWNAIKNFEKYEDFALEKTTTAIKYFTKLIFIFVMIISAVFTYQFYILANQAIHYFKTEIPDLTFSNQELHVSSEEPVMIENEKNIVSMIIMDTNSDEKLEEYRTKIDLYGNGIIILKDRVIVRNNMLANEMVYPYKTIAQNYGISDFDKPMAENYLASLNQIPTYIGGFVIIVIYMFVVYMLSGLLDAIMLGVLAWILAKIARVKMGLKNGFNIGMYALTLPILLNMIYIVVNQLTGFEISNFQWMYSIISYIYVFIAILMIRTDLMNRQVQLMKLQEEQQRVREELNQEEKQNPEEKKKEEEPKEGEEEKKEQKEKNGEQPDGSEA